MKTATNRMGQLSKGRKWYIELTKNLNLFNWNNKFSYKRSIKNMIFSSNNMGNTRCEMYNCANTGQLCNTLKYCTIGANGKQMESTYRYTCIIIYYMNV